VGNEREREGLEREGEEICDWAMILVWPKMPTRTTDCSRIAVAGGWAACVFIYQAWPRDPMQVCMCQSHTLILLD
jgi:hypothetical protein